MHSQDKISRDSIKVQVEKVLASDMFTRCPRLGRFLSFIAQKVFEGAAERLNEYLLAFEVFGKRASYDPRTDPIVRVEAHRLRCKIKKYYATQGRQDPIVIDFPRGSYVPIFRRRRARLGQVKAAEPTSLSRSPRDPKAIAVLPFADLSPERDQEYFCDGLTDELLNRLIQLDELRVVSRTSCLQFRQRRCDVREIGRRVNAGTVVEGSVRKSGNHVRIMVQLTDASSGYHLWSKEYDRETTDALAIQAEMSREIASALSARLLSSSGPSAVAV